MRSYSLSQSDRRSAFVRLQELVFERRPVLGAILSAHGSKTLREYAEFYYRSPSYPVNQARKKEFLEGFHEEVESIYGKEIAESCARQVSISYHIANTEHQGPLGMSRQLNNTLITSLPFLNTPSTDFPNNIVVACSNISFNNWTFPRGGMFHTYSNKGLNENQLVFFGHNVDSQTVFGHKGFSGEAVKLMRKSLYTLWNERYVWKKEYKKTMDIIDEVFSHPSVLKQTTYTNQSGIINYLLWKRIGLAIDSPLARLIYIEQEMLVRRLILKYHLEKDTTINRILFDSTYHDLITKYFDGILCGFSEKIQYGTYLFWAKPKGKTHRIQLWRRGKKLVSADCSYEVNLTPEDIRNGLLKNELIPSVLLSFILFCFYYGLRQIGGPNQTTYLTQMKDAFIMMEEELGESENILLCKDIPTTDFLPGTPPVLAFLRGLKGELIPSTAIDLYLYGGGSSVDTFFSAADKITLSESVARTLPLWYKRCYREDERESAILSITENDIDIETGLVNKLKPYASIGNSVNQITA